MADAADSQYSPSGRTRVPVQVDSDEMGDLMADYVELDEDEKWTAILAVDGWKPMEHAPHNAEVDAHIERCFGPPETILRERLSKFVQLDIHVIPPFRNRTFTTYVTSGMSDLAMTAPEGFEDWARAELVIALPGSPADHVDASGQRHYLIDHMRNYARRPHAMGSCFILGHTIGSLDADETIGPDTTLSAHLLSRPVLSPVVDSMDAFRAELSNGTAVNFLALEPIHADELDLKEKQGSDVLIDRLEAANVFELYNPARASVAPQKERGFSLKRLLGG